MQNGSFRAERSGWPEREAWKSQSQRARSASSCSSMSTQKLCRWLHCTSRFCYCLLAVFSATVVSREEVNMNLSLKILRRVSWLLRNLCLIMVVGLGSWIQMHSKCLMWTADALGAVQLLPFPSSAYTNTNQNDTREFLVKNTHHYHRKNFQLYPQTINKH